MIALHCHKCGDIVQKCRTCSETKHASDFAKNKNNKVTGLETICRACNKARKARYYAANKEHIDKLNTESRLRRIDDARARERERYHRTSAEKKALKIQRYKERLQERRKDPEFVEYERRKRKERYERDKKKKLSE